MSLMRLNMSVEQQVTDNKLIRLFLVIARSMFDILAIAAFAASAYGALPFFGYCRSTTKRRIICSFGPSASPISSSMVILFCRRRFLLGFPLALHQAVLKVLVLAIALSVVMIILQNRQGESAPNIQRQYSPGKGLALSQHE